MLPGRVTFSRASLLRQGEALTVGLEVGIPDEVVRRLLNHSPKTITGQRYVKPKLDFLHSAMQIAVDNLKHRLQGESVEPHSGQQFEEKQT